jgi:hypothetical protein
LMEMGCNELKGRGSSQWEAPKAFQGLPRPSKALEGGLGQISAELQGLARPCKAFQGLAKPSKSLQGYVLLPLSLIPFQAVRAGIASSSHQLLPTALNIRESFCHPVPHFPARPQLFPANLLLQRMMSS